MGWGFHTAAPLTAAEMSVYGSTAQPEQPASSALQQVPGSPILRVGWGGGRRFKSNRQCLNRFNTARVAAVIVALSLYLLMGAASVAAVMPPTHEHGRHAAAEAPGAASMAEGRPPRSGRRTRRENRKCRDITEDQRLPPFKARR